MEIVIKIPEDVKESIDKYKDIEWIDMSYLIYAIRNGTPLPKGHGDLVDLKEMVNAFWDGNFMEIWEDDLKKINVVVKADKEVGNADSN